jgi:uncharacterized C2H2 Zn-finger protein
VYTYDTSMPEASILEEALQNQPMMPLSLALKRQADVDLAPAGPDSNIKPSPVKSLLNTVAANRFKKRREDSLGGSDAGSSPPRDDSETDDKSLNGDMPAANEPRPFPCVWMNGTAGIQVVSEPEEKPSSPKSITNGATILPSLVSNGNPLEALVKNHLAAVSASGQLQGSMSPDHNTENGENLEVCPECHKVFKRKVYLQRHMEREHWSTAKVFKCDDCSYETKHQSNLSVHRRIHTGERPYNCGMCGATYTQGHLLKSHIRSKHGGNMEYYNLDKKSDSTRGRKSLDVKRDIVSPAQKQEKINSLVAQLEQQKMTQQMMNPTMSQYMSNMSYINSMRPLMASPMALTGNLMAGPRMFSVQGLQNGLGNGMFSLQQGMNMMAGHPGPDAVTPPSLSQAQDSPTAAMKIPLKIPDASSALYMSHPSPPFQSVAQQAPPTPPQDDPNAPQDLTTKRSPSRELNGTYSPVKDSTELPPESPTSAARVVNYVEPKRRGLKRPCGDEDHCDHAKKLRELRRNIVRMLSVLTPDLSIENGLNYNSDQVDELLHEVIFSNMEEGDEFARKT